LMKLISSYPEQYFWGYNRYKTPRGSSEQPPEKPL
jgi:lauroyl/myristoyl acyltransferase